MYISKLVIRNFRNFRRASFQLKPNVNTIIGENGSGKTNAFYALRLLLDSSLSYDSRYLEEKDFNRALGNWRGHWIIITAFFSALGTNEAEKLLLHGLGDGFNLGEGAYSFLFRPNLHFRTKLFELSASDSATQEDLRNLQNSIRLSDYEPIILSKGSADFSDDSEYSELVGNFETISFPNPNDKRFDKLGTTPNTAFSIQREISCTFIQALRDVARDLRSSHKNPLLNLLSKISNLTEIPESKGISDQIKKLNQEISELKDIKNLSNNISSILKLAVGKTYSPGVKIESSLPHQLDELIKSLAILVGDAEDKNHLGRVDDLSLGGANLLYLSLKLLEYELNHSNDKVAHLLLIEEPEAHIHKHIQRTLFDRLPLRQTQVILSTHSTHISSANKISQMNVLCINGKEANVYYPGAGLSDTAIERIERYLDITRVSLLFAKSVLLIEGDAEQILIPAMLKSILGVTADELGISIINVNGSFFSYLGALFDPQRIPRNCAIITDSDKSIVNLPSNPEDDTDELKPYRASQVAGEQRRQNLECSFSKNPYVKLCFANHTFEVDFLSVGNTSSAIGSLSGVYKSDGKQKREAESNLKNSTISVSGREILRLAEKQGKGWYGLLLAENISCKNYIPQYILKAIAFAAQRQLTPEVLNDIADYRLKEMSKLGVTDYQSLAVEYASLVSQALSHLERLKVFIRRLPTDPLTQLVAELQIDGISERS